MQSIRTRLLEELTHKKLVLQEASLMETASTMHSTNVEVSEGACATSKNGPTSDTTMTLPITDSANPNSASCLGKHSLKSLVHSTMEPTTEVASQCTVKSRPIPSSTISLKENLTSDSDFEEQPKTTRKRISKCRHLSNPLQSSTTASTKSPSSGSYFEEELKMTTEAVSQSKHLSEPPRSSAIASTQITSFDSKLKQQPELTYNKMQATSSLEADDYSKSWENLPPDLQSVVPSDEEYSYVIQSYEKHDKELFEGAPEFAFTSVIRINLETQTAVQSWVDKMMAASLCTYRVTRGNKLKGKRVMCKIEMHCQHYRKPLTPTQAKRASVVSAKRTVKPMHSLVRQRKTQCPSSLKLTLQIPTKKQQFAATKKPYLLTHKAVLLIDFVHNHPIHAAHSLSFRPVSDETKRQFFHLFDKGHCASSARHTHEQMLLLNAQTDAEKQVVLADRHYNPNVQDICRLFVAWRKRNYGPEDGKQLFEKLQLVVDQYTEQNASQGGKALLQWYERSDDDGDDSDTEGCKPRKKRKREPSSTPLILAICTPLMARAHTLVQQASEVVFCDSTSSLDRFNTSVFIVSTTSTASGVPLAVALTSDEKEETVYKAFETMKEVMPSDAFFGRGSYNGPQIFMVDDSIVEQSAIGRAWPASCVLLCTFHFLQRRWTWLHDSRNQIRQEDRITLIHKLKELVYAKTEKELQTLYEKLAKECPESTRYPHFLKHLSTLWEKRQSWAHCYRTVLPLRGNHTNNYAEAGIRILKELIFSRVKAYNLVQMFAFITEVMEMYYQKKLLSLANNRREAYIALRFQGIKAQKVPKEDIECGKDGWYKVRSQTTREEYYSVNPQIGFCSCERGKDGSPCIHQAAIVIQHGEDGLNYIGLMSSTGRQNLAKIALGSGAIKDTNFYASLHQKSLQAQFERGEAGNESHETTTNFLDNIWNGLSTGDTSVSVSNTESSDVEAVCNDIDEIAEDLKKRLREQSLDQQLVSGTKTFITRYQTLSRRSNAALASALYRFGWVFGGKVTSQRFGKVLHGKRITVQATAAGRRRKCTKRGKAPAITGRPAGQCSDKHAMPVRHEPKGKRVHNLNINIKKGQQNAGKW